MSTPTERPVPKGFALYVGLDEAGAAERGLDLGKVVEALKKLTNELVPGTETYAAVALAPANSRGRQVDLVRLALQEPSAVAKYTPEEDFEPSDGDGGVVVDISRKRVLIDYTAAPLTFKEFELLQFLVVHKGETISREEIIRALWREDDLDIPNERTIDVHVRRLRSKLGRFEDIVRTVRGVGYRYDTHADVTVMHAGTPSPDLF
jgi:DNA-binding winged helix-turn-helix (wHTH) protein